MTGESVLSGVVENLVTQFSSALDCVRELVQNAIDAGTDRVEVWTTFVAGDGHVGAIEIHVDDFGEGMDEAIVDNQLTKLFASTKEDDLTKIGKFGIGFVSVFALAPRAVLVHTGRAGEYWEVLFHEDRTFTKTRLEVPVEGTQVTIFVAGDYHEYREKAEGVRATLKRWCVHSETEVVFEDRSPAEGAAAGQQTVNEPFEVQGDCVTHVRHEGTEIALAYSERPSFAFYNRGLTLASSEVAEQVFSESRAARYRRVAVKVKSRYLEHTLSRESVMRDESYDKAMALLDEAREGPLVEALGAELEGLVCRPRWELAEMSVYARLVAHLGREPERCLFRLVGRPILRGVHGEAFSPVELEEGYDRDGRIFLSTAPSGLTRRVAEQGSPVLLGPAPVRVGSSVHRLTEREHPLAGLGAATARLVAVRRMAHLGRRVRSKLAEVVSELVEAIDGEGAVLRLFGRNEAAEVAASLADPDDVFFPVALDEAVPAEAASLVEGARRVLRAAGAGYGRLATFTPDPAASAPPFFVTARKLGPLAARPPAGGPPRRRRLEAAVNRDDPHFRALVRLSARWPELASYCLAKCLLLTDDRLLDRDLAMVGAALKGDK